MPTPMNPYKRYVPSQLLAVGMTAARWQKVYPTTQLSSKWTKCHETFQTEQRKKCVWKTIQHNARISGKAFNTKKTAKPAKVPPSSQVTCKCKFDCNTIVNVNHSLYETFHEQDMNTRGNHLMGLIQLLPAQSRRNGQCNDPAESRSQATLCFTVPYDTGKHHRKMGQTLYEDTRGSTTHFKFTQADINILKDDIDSILREPSHYSRLKSDKECIAFLEKHPQSKVIYKFNCQVLCRDFPQVAFRKLRVDTCKTCDGLCIKIKGGDKYDVASAKCQL
ncbi:hypothetical protein PR048_023882 [Dryococelus australis]|uniref:Uncharacterized protein n=1 Tax=Dryococelus australis TaxID=614101 RepID=A0ABQ9GVA5_9NEOP|nr:hypothetical protein PR048_023882 [Dryococelus australis]